MIGYTTHDDWGASEEVRFLQESYLARIRGMDFTQSPHLPRYFVKPFFNDGTIKLDYDFNRSLLSLEMESVHALHEVSNRRVALGLPSIIESHDCEDFTYTSTFSGVAYFSVERWTMEVLHVETGERERTLPRFSEDDYQFGEILDSELRQRLSQELDRNLFHLRIWTGWAKRLEIVFEKVVVKKTNDVKYESFLNGKRITLQSLYRG